ncbi:hypothetical protein C6A85_000000101160 [Mycobacterium sp. ITM-2017-0098]|nr:hypothetical protein C6A85_000000101160 [Mycobacterium sp. ITM-2017-0098]
MLPALAEGDSIDAARRRLGDFVGVLRHDGDQVMLVRPDGHLAWRGEHGDAALGRWLTSALEPGIAR